MISKKLCAWGVSLTMGMSFFVSPIHATEGSNAEVQISETAISIGNNQLARHFQVKNQRISTLSIENRRANKTLRPAQGSEDFVIHTVADDQTEVLSPAPLQYVINGDEIDRQQWTATLANAQGAQIAQEQLAKLFDGNLNTHVDQYQVSGQPFTLIIDMQQAQTISALSVDKRPGFAQDAYGLNGTMGGFELYVSQDGQQWTKATEGSFSAEEYRLHQVGNLYNVGDPVFRNFQAVTGRYVKLVQTSCALGSAEEFTSAELHLYKSEVTKDVVEVLPNQDLDRSQWSISVKNAQKQAFSETSARTIIDGNLETYPNEYTISGNPFTVEVDMKSPQTISSFSVDKRPGFVDKAYGLNGTLGQYELYTSMDGQDWQLAGVGEFTQEAYHLHQEGALYNVGRRVYANLANPMTAQYVRLVQKSNALGNSEELTSAEFHLYADQYSGYDWTKPVNQSDDAIRSSDLKFKEARMEESDKGKKLIISYEPYVHQGSTYTINAIYVMENGKHYMRSYLEIQTDSPQGEKIDSIDQDAFVLPSDVEGEWSIPDESQISSMWIGKHELMLGQPIYVDGLFLGNEFPAADTDIVDGKTQIRYYSGKNFERLREDGQLSPEGVYVTWQNVLGAAQSTNISVVQTEFFRYINDIATPTDFRKQYNSWYDNMMNITDESIAKSFYGAQDGLNEQGVAPLDAYVVDDGWNNYYDGTYTGPSPAAGEGTPNQTGFWEFNNKFPDELYPSTQLAKNLKSNFGLWVGPQGGYNFFSSFAEYLQSVGTGYVQSNSALGKVICTGSQKYLDNWLTRFLDYQDRFDIDYWKWDGFASRPCNDPSHDHMVGGYKDMYFTSDMWEKWIRVFERFRQARADKGKGLFINATCYVNLSPWMLRWVNTIWVQDSGDTGEIGTGPRHVKKIYYRDQVYYNLLKKNQVQFPLKNIYNHDPIYGVSDGSKASTEDFRQYLYANAVRGTAFWELYYSPSILDEAKWMVSADVLDWAEQNFSILQHAKLFGQQPSKGVYGYSSWDGTKGIVSFTNPTDEQQNYSLTLNDAIGVDPNLREGNVVQILPYALGQQQPSVSYGEDLNVELAPHETKIFEINIQDKRPLEVVSATNQGSSIRVKFSKPVSDSAEFILNGQPVQGQLMPDYRTYEISVDQLKTGQQSLQISKVTDSQGNVLNKEITFPVYENNIVTKTEVDTKPEVGQQAYFLDGQTKTLTKEGVAGKGTFSAHVAFSTQSTNASLLSQEGAWRLSIDENGYLVAEAGSATLRSQQEQIKVVEKANGIINTPAYQPTTTKTIVTGKINDGQFHTIDLNRQANGMLQLYVDGVLVDSVYDQQHLNESLEKAPIVLGGSSLQADIYKVLVKNKSFTQAQTEAMYQESNPSSLTYLDRSQWTASANSQMEGKTGDATAQAAIDGREDSWWHSNYVGKAPDGPHELTLDFHQDTTFDVISYMGRGGANGDVKKMIVYAKQDGKWNLILENQALDSSKVTNVITLAEPVKAEAIRFELLETVNGFGAAKEINLGLQGKPVDLALVQADLQKEQERMEKLNEKDYTSESWQAYQNAISRLTNYVKSVESGVLTSSAIRTQMLEEVQAAYDALIEQTAPAKPDFVIDSKGVDGVSVKLQAKNGMTIKQLQEAYKGYRLVVEKADDKTDKTAHLEKLGIDDASLQDQSVFRVYLMNEEGEVVQPLAGSEFVVTLPVSEALRQKAEQQALYVVHYMDNDQVEKMDWTYQSDTQSLQIKMDHFSEVAVFAQKGQTTPSDNKTQPKKPTSILTGLQTNTVVWGVGVLVALLGLIILKRGKRT